MAYTLPHTQITLPTPVTVGPYHDLEMPCGLAYTVPLHIDGTRVGTIANEGRGGETWLRTTNPHRPAWAKLIAQARDRHGRPLDEEELCERLVDEADLQQQVGRVQAKGRLPVRLWNEDGLMGISALPGKFTGLVTPTNVAVLAKLRLPEGAVGADVWIEGRWVQFSPSSS